MQSKIQMFQKQGGPVGTFFIPTAQVGRVGVIVIPGSDGGVPESIAARIASYGFPAFALGYFGSAELPDALERIDLEYFTNAVEHFKEMLKKDIDAIVLLGYSRGGELVLILGSLFPDLVQGIIASAPSCFAVGGFPHPNVPAWVLNNQPALPYIGGLTSENKDLLEHEDLDVACRRGIILFHENTASDPFDVVDLFVARESKGKGADIPVEKIRCPLLVFSGMQDKIWPAYHYSEEISRRLLERKSPIRRKFVNYPNAGHGVLAPYEGSIYHPVGKFWCTLGGTLEGNKRATDDAWKQIQEFIAGVLHGGH